MTDVSLRKLRGALEGITASILCTCDADGVPNASMISQVHWVDDTHVALSYQFFNKTRANLLATRKACVRVIDPATLALYRVHLDYVETRTSGPLFEIMKAKLAGIASYHGLEGVFRLLGADVFTVAEVEELRPPSLLPDVTRAPLLSSVRACVDDLSNCRDFDELVDTVLDGMVDRLGIDHAIFLVTEGDGRLFAVGSRGYADSGVGAEILAGEGVIGVAAREGVPIRIGHLSADYRYGAALGAAARRAGLLSEMPRGVRFPGLGAPHSQIAVPVRADGRVFGVLFAESSEIMRFGHEDEDALSILAAMFGTVASLVREDAPADERTVAVPAEGGTRPVTLRRYTRDDSVFIGHDYLIKGVAGAILWRLLEEHVRSGRIDFSTRELRLDPTLKLPDHAENLDTRLVLLRRRLDERDSGLRIEKTGRGMFRLLVNCRLALELVDTDAADVA